MEDFVPPSKMDAMDASGSPLNKIDELDDGFTSKKIDGFSPGNKSDSDSGDSDSESAHNKSDSIDQMFSASLKSDRMETLVRQISFKEILSSGEQYHDMVLRCNGESAGIPVHRLVLAAASPLLSRCLAGSEDSVEVVFPETVPSQLFHFVQYIYTGATDALNQQERQRLTELLERLCVGEDFSRDDPKFSLHKPVNSLKVKLEVDYDSTEDHDQEPEPDPEPEAVINYAAAEQFLWQNDTFKEEKKKKKRKVKNPVKNSQSWSGNDDDADYFGDKGDEDFHMGFRTDAVKVKEEVNGFESKPKKPKIEGNWTCKLCPKKFTKEQKYLDHQSVHTGEGLKCKFCPKLFERPGLRRVHEQLHTKPFKCESCDSSFGRKSNLIGHQRIHRGERPYICDLCGKGFPIQSSLLTHKKQSHPDVPKPWFCEFCELRFVSKSQLEIHKRSHTGEKPWICDSCGRGFTTKQNMLDHTRLHTDNMDYQCNVCSQRFKWKQSLERHLMDHTGIRPYPCVQCKLTFKTSNSLKKHGLSVHSDIKHFSCQYCGSRFSTSSGVLRHQKKQRCAAIKTGAVEMKDDQIQDKRLPYFNRHLEDLNTKAVKTEPQSNFGSLPLFLQEAAHNFQNNQRPQEGLGIHGLHQAILEKSGQGLHQALIEQRGQMEQRGPLALDRQSVSQPLALHRPPPLHQQRNQQPHQLDRPPSPDHYGRQSPNSGPPSVERMTPTSTHVSMADRTQHMQSMAANFRNTQPHHLARPPSPDHYGRRSPDNSGGPPSVDRMTPTATHVSMVDDRGIMGDRVQQMQAMGERPLAMTVPRPGMTAQVHNYYGKGWAAPSNLEKEVVNSIQP